MIFFQETQKNKRDIFIVLLFSFYNELIKQLQKLKKVSSTILFLTHLSHWQSMIFFKKCKKTKEIFSSFYSLHFIMN